MRNARSARKSTRSAKKNIRETPEYRFAMREIEKFIEEACEIGENKIEYNICGLCKDIHDTPSKALRDAIKEELEENGYDYYEFNSVSLNGGINPCFGVEW